MKYAIVHTMPVPSQRLFGPGKAAEYLGLSSSRLWKITNRGELRAFNLNGRRAYKLEDLNALLEKELEEVEAPAEKPERVRNDPPEHTKVAGVYFIKSSATGLIKIGGSKYIFGRLLDLRDGSPEDYEVLAVVPMSGAELWSLEKSFHERFREYRVRREWFRITDVMVADAIKERPLP